MAVSQAVVIAASTLVITALAIGVSARLAGISLSRVTTVPTLGILGAAGVVAVVTAIVVAGPAGPTVVLGLTLLSAATAFLLGRRSLALNARDLVVLFMGLAFGFIVLGLAALAIPW